MALISAKDFLANRSAPPLSGVDGSDSSNNSPSQKLSSPSKGLMSASDFLKNKQMNHISPEMSQDDIMTSQHQVENAVGFSPKPFSNDPIVPSMHSLLNPDASQFMQSVNQINADNPQSFADQVQKPNFLDKIFKDNPIARVLNYPFAKAAQLSVPDANYLGSNVNARQDFAQRNPIPSTGSPLVDKVGDFAGGIGSFFTPIGGFGTGAQNVASDIVGRLGATKLGMQAESALGNLGAAAANKINPSLLGQGIQLSPNLASKTAQLMGKGALDFGIANPLHTAATEEPTPQSMLNSAAQGALWGGALGGGFGLAGAGLQKLAGTKLGDAVSGFLGRGKSLETPSIQPDQPILGLPEPRSAQRLRDAQQSSILEPNTNPIYGQGDIHTFGLPEGNYTQPTRFKTMGQQEQFSSAMDKVMPVAKERLIPPLENQNELAKWVQGHLNDAGHDVSLNEVRGLNYEDLRQLAEEMRPRIDATKTVSKVANEMGYGKIFDETAPSIKQQIAKDAQSRAYGFPAPKVDIAKPNFNIIHNADAAMPETKIGFDRKPLDIVRNTKTVPDLTKIKKGGEISLDLNRPIQEKSNTAPIADVVPNAEPRIRDKVTNYLDEAAQAARERLKAKRNTLSSNPIDQYSDYAIIGASHLANGAVKFADFSTRMIADFGDSIKPHLKEIFNRSKDVHKDAERQASGVAHLPGVNSGIDPLKGNKVDIQSLEGAIENSANWKDKNRLLLNRETTDRNFEDVMGKDAPIMNKTYIEPIQKAAADRQRFITQERKDIKDLGIKYKSPEDALVQKYGEGKMSELELQAASPDNWQKIKTAAETMRSKYDEYLNMANEVLKRNGYPEIPKRKDYFPHYEEIDGLMSKLGFGFEDNTLPADLNGITANLKPGKNFFANALQRKGTDTTLGAMAGHDRYIEGISKIIHQTDNIKRLRGLDKTLRDTHEGTTHLSDFLGNLTDYTNILAGKKTEMDRSLEAATGRNLYGVVDWIKKRVGSNMIGGSVSSALTNSIPVTQLLAETSKTSVLKGLTSALQNLKGNDAIGQDSNFLSRRFTSDKLAMGPIDKAQKAAGVLFKGIDHFTSNVVIRSKYYENLKKGMPEAEALHAADQYATRMMADRSEGSMPTLFHSRTFGLVTQFQLEVNNQLSHLFKDMPNSMSKTKYASAITQVFIYDYLYNQLYEKVTGQRPAFDPLGVAAHAVQDYTNPRLSKGKASGNLIGNITNNLPFASVATGGRIPVGAALPNVFGSNGLIKGNAKLSDELLKPAKFLALPFGGSQINKTITGLDAVNQGGIHGTDPQGKDILKYPIEQSPANIARGALFGKSALPETNNFYQNNTPVLTAKETEVLKKHGNDPKMYDKIMIQKQMNSLDDKFNKIDSNPNLSKEQKRSQIDAIKVQVRDLKAKMMSVK